MNYYERPTPLQETANAEAMTVFAEHMKQFKSDCENLHNLERNLTTTANDAFKAALQSSGHQIQTDDGEEWQHGIKLMENASLCHRRTVTGLEFAVVEILPLNSGAKKDVVNSGQDVREVLQAFTRDQRQTFKFWKDDVTERVREHLAEKYPRQDMSIVAESFEIKLARAISQRPTLIQNQSHGVRI
jgi:hypothetical protein